MTTQRLSSEHREQMLESIEWALQEADPEHFLGIAAGGPGGFNEIAGHLDALVDIVRRTTTDQVEPYLAQMMDEVCPRCRNQAVCGHCSLRHSGGCITFGNAKLIVETIGRVLRDLRDPEYWTSHFDHKPSRALTDEGASIQSGKALGPQD